MRRDSFEGDKNQHTDPRLQLEVATWRPRPGSLTPTKTRIQGRYGKMMILQPSIRDDKNVSIRRNEGDNEVGLSKWLKKRLGESYQ